MDHSTYVFALCFNPGIYLSIWKWKWFHPLWWGAGCIPNYHNEGVMFLIAPWCIITISNGRTRYLNLNVWDMLLGDGRERIEYTAETESVTTSDGNWEGRPATLWIDKTLFGLHVSSTRSHVGYVFTTVPVQYQVEQLDLSEIVSKGNNIMESITSVISVAQIVREFNQDLGE